MTLNKNINRRKVLRNAGISLTLPSLEAFTNEKQPLDTSSYPQRLFVMSNPLGMVPQAFHPKQDGPDYELPELLVPFKNLKKEISVFTNLDHGLRGGHEMTHAFLSGVQQKEAKSMPNRNISLDQHIAQHWAGKTRYNYLSTKAGRSRTGGFSSPALSWTREGINIPPIDNPGELFKKLFINDSQSHLAFKSKQFSRHQSILDAVYKQAKQLTPMLSQSDRQLLDQYFTSIRKVEKKLLQEKHWLKNKKPDTQLEQTQNLGLYQSLEDFFELIYWAFKTDLTRVATLEIPGDESGRDFGLMRNYHSYSHHGQSEENLSGVKVFELFQMQALAKFIERISREKDPLMQDQTMLKGSLILFGSGLSNASAHTNTNLPILLAGGGFKHGQHHFFEPSHKPPLSNLWLSILRKFQFKDESFGRSTGTLKGFSS
jgi:hypothetical protein